MTSTWTLVADQGRARIFEHQASGTKLVEVEDFVDPLAHTRDSQLSRGTMGRFDSAAGSPSHAGSPKSTHLDHEAQEFARHLVSNLSEALAAGRFDRLNIAAPPRFLGILRDALPHKLEQLVDQQWDKDWCQCSAAELAKHLSNTANI
jgi:protein required for attachment to host cells